MTTYSREFYEQQQRGSLRSARTMLPHVFELVRPASVVDVGCGVGTWLAAARELGLRDVVGLDGDYVDRGMLQIPAELFRPTDLRRPFSVDRSFDLAVSLEVAEHLPVESAMTFVRSITGLAPVALFSAAIPRQGGERHLNEQWQSWWVERFRSCGFEALDCVRPLIWDDRSVEWWYAQNTLLMVRRDYLDQSDRFRGLVTRGAPSFDLVHPRGYESRLDGEAMLRPRGVSEWLAIGPSLIAASLTRLFRRSTPARDVQRDVHHRLG